MNKRNKNKKGTLKNFLLEIFDIWRNLNEELPEEIEKSIKDEEFRQEKIRKLGPRPSNKDKYFTAKEVEIITNIISDPRQSYIDMSKKMGLSRHTARRRLEKMIKQKKIKILLGINYQKLNLNFILVDLIAVNLKLLDEIYQELETCPRVFTIVKNPLKNGLMILLGMEKNIYEDNNLMLVMIEKIQLDPRVKECNVMNLYPEIAPIFLTLTTKNLANGSKNIHCNHNCSLCDNFTSGKCPGCPARKQYNPNIFKMA